MRSCFSIRAGLSSARPSSNSFPGRRPRKPPHSSRERCLGPDSRLAVVCRAVCRLGGRRAGQVHRGRLNDFNRTVGLVRLPAADLREENRHPGAGGCARNGTGARSRAPGRCGRGVRACQVGGREVSRGRPWSKAFSGHVQRLRADRTEVRPCQGRRRHGHPGGAEKDQSGRRAVRVAWRPERTHIAELELWKLAGIDLAKDKGPWYRDTGQGMGPALNTAAAMNAYVLSDRGTWISFKNRGELAIAVEGDRHLFNQYGVMLVSPAKHPSVKKDLGQAFVDWVISPEGQKTIAGYKLGGEQLFFPNSK